MLLLASPSCYAHRYTLADANSIIVILIFIVIALIVMGCYSIQQCLQIRFWHHAYRLSEQYEQNV